MLSQPLGLWRCNDHLAEASC